MEQEEKKKKKKDSTLQQSQVDPDRCTRLTSAGAAGGVKPLNLWTL